MNYKQNELRVEENCDLTLVHFDRNCDYYIFLFPFAITAEFGMLIN